MQASHLRPLKRHYLYPLSVYACPNGHEPFYSGVFNCAVNWQCPDCGATGKYLYTAGEGHSGLRPLRPVRPDPAKAEKICEVFFPFDLWTKATTRRMMELEQALDGLLTGVGLHYSNNIVSMAVWTKDSNPEGAADNYTGSSVLADWQRQSALFKSPYEDENGKLYGLDHYYTQGDNAPPCPECSATGQHYMSCSKREE